MLSRILFFSLGIFLVIVVSGGQKIVYAASVTDTDGDGLPDKIEKIFKTSTVSKDSDGDGYNDLKEITNGYNPLGNGKWKPSKAMAVAWNSYKSEQKKATKPEISKKKSGKAKECGKVSDKNEASVLKCMDQALKTCQSAIMEEDDLFGINRQEIFQQKDAKKGCVVKLTYKEIASNVLGGDGLKGKEMTCPLDLKKKTYRDAFPQQLAGCSGPLKKVFDSFLSSFSSSQTTPQTPSQYDVAFETLTSGMYKGQKKKEYIEVNFQDDWVLLWSALYPNKDFRPPLPTIDFIQKKIVAFFGERDDFAIKLTKLSDSDGMSTYYIEHEQQRKKCPIQRTLEQPFTVIVVPKNVGSKEGRAIFPSVVEKDCQSSGQNEPNETFLYKNQKFDLQILLPDAIQYFTVKESEKETSQYGTFTFLQFSQYSGKENKQIESFTLAIVPADKWGGIEKASGIGLVSGGFASAHKVGVTKTHVIAWYGVGGSSFGPDDIGEYSSKDITVISQTQ